MGRPYAGHAVHKYHLKGKAVSFIEAYHVPAGTIRDSDLSQIGLGEAV